MSHDSDLIELPDDDFRRHRSYLAPWVFAWPDDEPEAYPPPSDLVSREHWDGIMLLPTDVALKSSDDDGSLVGRLYVLQSEWIFSWPEQGEAPFMEEASLLAGEEFDALVFNALHGWYRQAIGCLRNAMEIMIVAAACSVSANAQLYADWRAGTKEVPFREARGTLRNSPLGTQVDADAAPESVFGDSRTAWIRDRYARLCSYAHSQAGHNNADFWESNGPIYVPAALHVVEAELRETLALCYLLLRLGWLNFQPGPGSSALLSGPQIGWVQFDGLLRKWLRLPTS